MTTQERIRQIGTLILILSAGLSFYGQQRDGSQPNFLIIVADDMGYSDPGAFGGEIYTPNLDALADSGVRYTNFYVAPTCSPTRSMLLTGIDNHLVGLGNMYEYTASNQMGEQGYEGFLTNEVPTLAEVLRDHGYHTYMTGKWHLGKDPEHTPAAQGFERSFSMLSGSGSYFSLNGPDEDATPNHFNEDGRYLSELPRDYYATKTFTDKLIAHIEANKNDGKPFLAYLAHQAPHDPLMVPTDYLRKYKGRFDGGWDSLREGRLLRMKRMGILPERSDLGERLWYVPGFEKLKPLSQVVVARKMEVYAAVLEYMDMQIGRLLDYLKKNGMYDNTYVIFFSDNGPDVSDKASNLRNYPATAAANWMAKTYKHGFQNWGRAESFTAYGPSWAQVSCTPFYGFKYTTYEGGIRSPLIVAGPGLQDEGSLNSQALMHVKDIMPTLLDLAGISATALETKIPIQGKSWKDLLSGTAISPRTESDYLGTELYTAKAIRKGDWKIVNMYVPIGTGDWELYNLAEDPGERHDLAKANPEKLKELIALWEEYVQTNNVILPNRTPFDGVEERLPPRPPVYDPDFGRGSEKIEFEPENK